MEDVSRWFYNRRPAVVQRRSANASNTELQNGQKKVFSAKSAYHLGMELQALKDTNMSNTELQNGRWKRFWRVKVAPKIKISCWKIVKDILPTKSNLVKMGITTDRCCVLCRLSEETTTHLFWDCKVVKDLWSFLLKSYVGLSALHRSS